jgi:hypothetical protein
MPISHPHKAILVHIPKTAGTSVEVVLGMHGARQDVGIVPYFNQELDFEHLYGRQMQHMTVLEIRAALKNDALFTSYFKFTIVRNPWDRLVSALAWTDQKWARGEELTRGEFDQQVKQVHALLWAARTGQNSVPVPRYLYPQHVYIQDGQGQLLVDFVARYETLEQDWEVIARRLGINQPLPQRMRSVHRPYREYYTPETRELVTQMYGEDARLFGYEH